MTLVGVWSNRDWILGNWLKEVKKRHPRSFRIVWVPFIYAQRYFLEKIVVTPIPHSDAYFFSYPTIFRRYLKKNQRKYAHKSIVLYPHYEPEMGSINEVAQLLNSAHTTYFFCSRDAETLVASGLEKSKVRVAHCAVDNDCVSQGSIKRDKSTVVLASKFGPRKGLEILPELLKRLPKFHFIALGRDWEEFISENQLRKFDNFEFHEFNLQSRNKYFSQASIFLSLSRLEGGPVPLIEASAMGCRVIATDTGFARDLIQDGINGIILNNPPTMEQLIDAFHRIESIYQAPEVSWLTWDRISRMMLEDLQTLSQLRKGLMQ